MSARREYAEVIVAQLRGMGPQSVQQLADDLGLTKRKVDDALWLLASTGRVEYAGAGAPLTYKAVEVQA